MSEQDRVIVDVVICKPLSVGGYIAPGSIVRKCAHCDELITLAPSSQGMLRDNPAMITVCGLCGARLMRDNPGRIEPPTPAQREEIHQALYNKRN
jgi:hypothetical protein